MMKTIFIIISALFLSGCMNKHGISAKYYSDCKEYYDLQGYYHKECGEDDMVTYKEMGDATSRAVDYVLGKEEKPKGNVW